MTRKRNPERGDATATSYIDLSKVPEAEFSYSVLNAIFFEKLGQFRGTRTLTIGGIEVTKSVSGPYKSNSGKSRDWNVEITWTGSDGTKHVTSNGGSRYARNRRNDEERNWGLPD